jgi:hypothetical protein
MGALINLSTAFGLDRAARPEPGRLGCDALGCDQLGAVMALTGERAEPPDPA